MASNWQKRARNMLDMLNPSGSKGAAVRADQLRQLHSSGAAVPVNMPEKEELQLVISFWAQWEAGVSAPILYIILYVSSYHRCQYIDACCSCAQQVFCSIYAFCYVEAMICVCVNLPGSHYY
jgi:hypothetical protein